MPDPTNDIDALLDLLAAQSRFGFHYSLTALVAERDKAKSDFSEAWRERSEFAKRIDEADSEVARLRAELAAVQAQLVSKTDELVAMSKMYAAVTIIMEEMQHEKEGGGA